MLDWFERAERGKRLKTGTSSCERGVRERRDMIMGSIVENNDNNEGEWERESYSGNKSMRPQWYSCKLHDSMGAAALGISTMKHAVPWTHHMNPRCTFLPSKTSNAWREDSPFHLSFLFATSLHLDRRLPPKPGPCVSARAQDVSTIIRVG